MSTSINVTGNFIWKAKELWKLDQLVQIGDEGLRCVARYAVQMRFKKRPDCDPRAYFTNEAHYLVLANNTNWDRLRAVVQAGDLYLVLAFESRTPYYVVGRQVGGGLFLHGVDRMELHLPWIDKKAVFVGRVDPVIVRFALGFLIDAELEPVDLNEHSSFVRVQGDVILRPSRIEDFRRVIEDILNQQLNTILMNYYLRRVADALTSQGVNVDFLNPTTIVIPFPWVEGEDWERIYEALTKYVRDIINDDAVDVEVALGYTPTGLRVELRINRDKVRDEGTRSYIAAIYRSVVDAVAREYVKYEGEYQLSFGRHVIRYVGWPQSASMFVDTPIGKLLININFPATQFIAREVMITHPEHKPFYHRFNKPMLIEVHNVRNTITDMENYYAPTKLLNIEKPKITWR